MNEPTAAVDPQEEEKPLPGQQDMSDYPDYVPEVQEKGLSFMSFRLAIVSSKDCIN